MTSRPIPVCFLVVLALWLTAAPGRADGDDIRRRGPCSGGPSGWELRVRRGSGSALRIGFEIAGGAEGQPWQLFLSHDGARVYAGTKLSGGGGHVRVRRPAHDRRGRDRITASGVNLSTGETCLGVVRV